MKRFAALLTGVLLPLSLSGCSMLGLGMTPNLEDADLVVRNDSPQVIYTITLTTQVQSESVSSPQDMGLLERGERYGFTLEDGAEQFTLELKGEGERLLARCQGSYQGKRLLITLEEDGGVSASEA